MNTAFLRSGKKGTTLNLITFSIMFPKAGIHGMDAGLFYFLKKELFL